MTNPIAFITPEDPPFLVMHGEQDKIVPFNQSEILVEALEAEGVPVEFYPDPDRGHTKESPDGDFFDPQLLDQAIDFFDRHL
ncbi:MAG: prolyl oligopeptidase family serine peptidase [Cyanobacteria bacterium P01_D01_bin.44]